VTVLGQIAVTFVPEGDTWDFGDGGTATGSGIEDAVTIPGPGAVLAIGGIQTRVDSAG
jgi:hypothetical protein